MTAFLHSLGEFTTKSLLDVSIISAVLNLFNTGTNIYWAWYLKGIQATSAGVNYWKEKCSEKDNQITELKDTNTVLEQQYAQVLNRNKELEGRVAVYQKFHNHPKKD